MQKSILKEWEKEFILSDGNDLSMTFASFANVYCQDMLHKIREHTWQTKNAIIDSVILPYFGDMPVSSIKATDIMKWQNKMHSYRNDKGKQYSQAYLKSINSQLSAIFNHAVKYFELGQNPVTKAGSMGKMPTGETQRTLSKWR